MTSGPENAKPDAPSGLVARLRASEFLRNLTVLMSGTALAQLLPMLASPIISRLYDPHQVGLFTAFSSIVAGLVTVAAWRYDLAIVLPSNDADARGLVRLATRLNALTCVIVGLALIVFAGPISTLLHAPDLKLWLAFVGLTAWLMAQIQVFSYWCNRKRAYTVMSTNKLVQSGTATGLQVGFGPLGFGTAGLVLGHTIGQGLAAFTMWRRTRASIAAPDGEQPSDLAELRHRYRKMPLLNGPTAVMDTIRLNGTQLLVQVFFTTAALGQYGQALRLLQAPSALINSSLSQIFYQKLAVTERGQMTRVVRQGIVRSALVGVVPFALLWWLSPPLFPIVFGHQWALAGQLGAAMVPWLYVNFITSPVSTLFVVTGRQELLFWFSFPMTAVPLGLIAQYHHDILATVTALSWAMAVMLLGFLVLAMVAARGYDHGRPAPGDEEAGTEAAGVTSELAVESTLGATETDLGTTETDPGTTADDPGTAPGHPRSGTTDH